MFLLLQTYRVNKVPSLPLSFLSNTNNEQSFQAYVTKEGGCCASENVTILPKNGVVRVTKNNGGVDRCVRQPTLSKWKTGQF